MPGLIGGRWRSGSHGEPEGCTRRETGGIEPGRLQLADQPAAYLTAPFRSWQRGRPIPGCTRTAVATVSPKVHVGEHILGRPAGGPRLL